MLFSLLLRIWICVCHLWKGKRLFHHPHLERTNTHLMSSKKSTTWVKKERCSSKLSANNIPTHVSLHAMTSDPEYPGSWEGRPDTIGNRVLKGTPLIKWMYKEGDFGAGGRSRSVLGRTVTLGFGQPPAGGALIRTEYFRPSSNGGRRFERRKCRYLEYIDSSSIFMDRV